MHTHTYHLLFHVQIESESVGVHGRRPAPDHGCTRNDDDDDNGDYAGDAGGGSGDGDDD